MDVTEIQQMPTVINKTHESVYRSYQILEKVKEMLDRRDSNRTIMEFIYLMETPPNQVV